MLAGEPPFVHGSAVELGLRHLQDRPPTLPVRVPPALREVVYRALAKDPADRYRDGAAMAAALGAADSSVGPRLTASATGVATEDGEDSVGPAETGATDTLVMAEAATVDVAGATTRNVAAIPTSVLEGASVPPLPTRPPSSRLEKPARRRRWIVLPATLLLLAVCALMLFLLSAAVGHTTVPALRGLPRAGVQARARRLHVQPEFSSRYSDAAPGIAIAQDPSAGTRVKDGSRVGVVLSAGPPPVRVPGLVGQSSASAESLLANVGLRYGVTLVPAPGSVPGAVTKQSPGPAATIPRGSTVALSVSEAPRWRPLTTFSGVDSGQSVPFRILGSKWRVFYSMSYQGTCLLLVVCFGPSAEARNLRSNSTFGGFELGEGESLTHTFSSGSGLYRLLISGGRDSARWSMTVEDYY
jgi:serine/threonine-protein kinase